MRRSHEPARSGVHLHFDVADIRHTLRKAVHAGGMVLCAQTAVGTSGFVAQMEDPEGNGTGLHAMSHSKHAASQGWQALTHLGAHARPVDF
ncbi:VOC family protein [Pantoea sp. 18069]|uniref:VOC family protein n=1 Tax=Pantoea sp. 18069 TaxID=2681415 RepID=UPI001357ED76